MSAVVFDWDGTLISCEEKIDATIKQLCLDFPNIQMEYEVLIARKGISHGWLRKGFVSSLPEDYFTYHFGIFAELLSKNERITNDEAWSIILNAFKKCYRVITARTLADREKLEEISEYAELFIVSNSSPSNLWEEAGGSGFNYSFFNFVGDAKKYQVVAAMPMILGISVARPHYRQVLLSIQEKHSNDIIVIGDNFSLDLVTPLSENIRVAYIPNAFTPKEIVDFTRDRNILSGTVNNIIEVVIREYKRRVR